jgi:predicted DNA binding CopG/RHH family protein
MKNKEEAALIKSIENDEWKRVKNFTTLKTSLEETARQTMKKDQRMNIRIATRDLLGLKAKALEEGMPYQTLVSRILHKYITGRLVEAPENPADYGS